MKLTLHLALMALAVTLMLGSGAASADRRIDICSTALEDHDEQLKRSKNRIETIYEQRGREAEELNSSIDRFLEGPVDDNAKSNVVRELLDGYNDAHQSFLDLARAWQDREALLRSLGKIAVECANSR